jgi:AcrR family transcriptional regulator
MSDSCRGTPIWTVSELRLCFMTTLPTASQSAPPSLADRHIDDLCRNRSPSCDEDHKNPCARSPFHSCREATLLLFVTDRSVFLRRHKHGSPMAYNSKPIPASSSKVRRQARILGAAFQEFAANGYAGARLDDVAKRAKIAKGTIFLHFRDKKALFRAVLRNSIQPLASTATPSSPESCSHDAVIRNLLSRLYAEVVENRKARSLLRLLVAESEKFPELAEMYYREVILPGASTMAAAIEAGVDSGQFHTNAGRFPQIVAGPAILAAVWALLLGRRHELDLSAYREAHLDFVMKSLCSELPAVARDRAALVPGRSS